jgi:hypothetical protein
MVIATVKQSIAIKHVITLLLQQLAIVELSALLVLLEVAVQQVVKLTAPLQVILVLAVLVLVLTAFGLLIKLIELTTDVLLDLVAVAVVAASPVPAVALVLAEVSVVEEDNFIFLHKRPEMKF